MYVPITGLTIMLLPEKPAKVWVWCEHRMGGEPFFECISRLEQMQEMREGRSNSAWSKWIKQYPGYALTITVKMMGDDPFELERLMMEEWTVRGSKPHCNEYGYMLGKTQRVIVTTDGRRFTSQVQAAQALGVSQSAVSQALRNFNRTVGGTMVRYLYGDDTVAPEPAPPVALTGVPLPPPPPAPTLSSMPPMPSALLTGMPSAPPTYVMPVPSTPFEEDDDQ